MDGSLLTGLTSMVSLTDGGVIAGLILLGWFLHKHIAADKEDRRQMYIRFDAMKVELLEKLEDVRKEAKNEHDGLVEKVDRISATVYRLEGFHSKDDNK